MADGFGYDDATKPSAFVQWKNTNVCMDFHCDCGAHCHFDGYFANAVKCQHCQAEWEMPWNLYPRRLDRTSEPDKGRHAKLLEPDEDHSDDVVGDDGISRWVARPLTAPRKGKP